LVRVRSELRSVIRAGLGVIPLLQLTADPLLRTRRWTAPPSKVSRLPLDGTAQIRRAVAALVCIHLGAPTRVRDVCLTACGSAAEHPFGMLTGRPPGDLERSRAPLKPSDHLTPGR
jgi:hypothetical protein